MSKLSYKRIVKTSTYGLDLNDEEMATLIRALEEYRVRHPDHKLGTEAEELRLALESYVDQQ